MNNLGSLTEELGTDGVNKIFTEYMMSLVAKSNLLDKVIDYVTKNNFIDKLELERLLAGDTDDEGANFYT